MMMIIINMAIISIMMMIIINMAIMGIMMIQIIDILMDLTTTTDLMTQIINFLMIQETDSQVLLIMEII